MYKFFFQVFFGLVQKNFLTFYDVLRHITWKYEVIFFTSYDVIMESPCFRGPCFTDLLCWLYNCYLELNAHVVSFL